MKKSPSIDDIKAQSMLNAKLAKGQRERIEQKKFRNNVEITHHHHATIPTSTIKTNGSKKGSNAIINGGGTVAVPPDTTIRKSIYFGTIYYLYALSKLVRTECSTWSHTF